MIFKIDFIYRFQVGLSSQISFFDCEFLFLGDLIDDVNILDLSQLHSFADASNYLSDQHVFAYYAIQRRNLNEYEPILD